MGGSLSRRIVAFWQDYDADGSDLCEYGDACEALALATAARVEAERRRDMALLIEHVARRRADSDTFNNGMDRLAAGQRERRAWARVKPVRSGWDAARSAECAALARWREVRGG